MYFSLTLETEAYLKSTWKYIPLDVYLEVHSTELASAKSEFLRLECHDNEQLYSYSCSQSVYTAVIYIFSGLKFVHQNLDKQGWLVVQYCLGKKIIFVGVRRSHLGKAVARAPGCINANAKSAFFSLDYYCDIGPLAVIARNGFPAK